MFEKLVEARNKKDEGFTLIELLVVIIIIGILAAIAIPVFLNQRKKGWDSAVKSDLRNAATAEETYYTDNGKYTKVQADLEAAGFKQSDVTANYGAAGFTIPTGDANAYCLEGESKSTAIFHYSSESGGLQDGPCT